MNAIKVSIRLVDGGMQEFTCEHELLHKLHSLQSQGLAGKQLIQSLITDDWGAPPVLVEIKGIGLNGENLAIRIPYS